jgi:hypothetical protein
MDKAEVKIYLDEMHKNKPILRGNMKTQQEIEKITELIYKAARLEAIWSKRSIIPEKWEERDEKFRKQMIDVVEKYLAMEQLPTPEEAHNSWMKSYFEMGWKYGEKRDVEKKTHPDLVPFYDLPQDERDKDAIFLALVWLAKYL